MRRSIAAAAMGALLVCATSCGSSAPSAPSHAADPLPAPTPTPTPVPAPTPTPAPTPEPCVVAGLCEAPTTNTAPPVTLAVRVYFVENDQSTKTKLGEKDEIPVGYIVHLDVTAKDANKKETLGSTNVLFFFSGDTGAAEVSGNHQFQRKIRVLGPGYLDCQAELDGVKSRVMRLKFIKR